MLVATEPVTCSACKTMLGRDVNAAHVVAESPDHCGKDNLIGATEKMRNHRNILG